MVDKLSVGVIGCGSMANFHVRGYLESGRYEVVAVADLSSQAMEEFERRFSASDDYHPRYYTDATAMLDTEELEVVSVCVWHRGHARWTMAAAARRPKAILCEKPMAEDLGRADEMIMACERNNVKLVIGHQRRFLPSYNAARRLIAEGAIGEVQLMRSVSGAGLLNWASHQFDMFRYLLSDADCTWAMGAIERQTDRFERSTRIEDRAFGVFGFSGGVEAILTSDLTPDYYQGCTIYGSEGTIDLRPTHYTLLNADTKGASERRAPAEPFIEAGPAGVKEFDASVAQAAELADWIEGRVEMHRGEAGHGYKSVEMAMALYESARLHERVTLPLQTRVSPLDLMVESGHLPIRYPGRYDIRARLLRGENMSSDEENE